MPILRDVVARLGMDFDGKGFKKADTSIKGLIGGVGKLGLAIGTVGAAMGGLKLLDLASDANETLNVINASFGEGTQEVKAWADSFAQDASRSEFEMRELAATIGAVLNPLMERNQGLAAEMSKSMSELAVDLGSFFNATDTDALNALRSGIVGEAEPLKRFGVVMTEATLAAFAMDQGIKKNIKTMTIAEKTTLRYNYILDQTSAAHGDAIKTSKGWANATKGLTGGLKDLGTNIGLTFLPAAEKVLLWLSDLTRGFSRIVKETEIVKASMILLGSVATVLAVKMLVAFAPLIIKFILIGAAVAAVVLVMEDFIGFLQGKKSAIGEFINLIAGPGSAEEAANYLKTAWEGLTLYFKDQVIPGLDGLKNALIWLKDDAVQWVEDFGNSIVDFFGPAIEVIKELVGWISKVSEPLMNFLGVNSDKLKQNFKDTFKTGESEDYTGLTRSFMDTFSGNKAGINRFRQENEAAIRANPMLATSAGSQGQKVIAQMSQELNVNVTGLSDAQAAKRIAKAVAGETKKETKRTMVAVTQRAE